MHTPPGDESPTLCELLDRVLAKGAVVNGDITLSLAGIDLVYARLLLMLSAVGAVEGGPS